MTKTCSRCKMTKNINDFHRHPQKIDGRRPECKDCRKNNIRPLIKPIPTERTCKNCGILKPINDFYKRLDNKNSWQYNCKECQYLLTFNSKINWARNNPERTKEIKLNSIKRNPDKHREITNKNAKKRYRVPHNRINHIFSSSIRKALKGNKNYRSWQKLVYYNEQDLKKHLQSKFTEGMTWENYGKNGWVIDHILPQELFEFSNPEDMQFIICWSLNNLRPLWCKENDTKSDYLPNGKRARHLTKQEKVEYLKSLGYII